MSCGAVGVWTDVFRRAGGRCRDDGNGDLQLWGIAALRAFLTARHIVVNRQNGHGWGLRQ